MFNSHRYKPLLFFKLKALIDIPFQKPSPFLSYSFNFCTQTASETNPYAVSYLIDNLGFSPQSALKAAKRLRFKTQQKPDVLIAFLKSYGFSHSQITSTVRKQPIILGSDPKKLLPKFQFLASKGASASDIVRIVTTNPIFALSNLENNIIHVYEILRDIFQSDKEALRCILNCPFVFLGDRLAQNVKLLLDEGLIFSNLRYLLRTRAIAMLSSDIKKVVDELKELGFDPSQVKFGIAFLAKRTIPKSLWDAKIDSLKSWGWSEELISKAFQRQPLYMLTSKDKINKVMRLWVEHLGWNPLAPAKLPEIFGYSLERRIIPRAFVIQHLLARGLRNKNHSLVTPFGGSEEVFLETYVERFTEERSQLLKIYWEKKNVQDQDNRE